jgi:ankyrin repeat protein
MMERRIDADRLVLLCERLADATAARRVEWRLEQEDRFVWLREDGSVSITSRDHDGDPPYELAVLNAGGEPVDELSSDLVGEDEPAPWNEPLADLYRVARRSALRADDIIDALIDALPPSRAEAVEVGRPAG